MSKEDERRREKVMLQLGLTDPNKPMTRKWRQIHGFRRGKKPTHSFGSTDSPTQDSIRAMQDHDEMSAYFDRLDSIEAQR